MHPSWSPDGERLAVVRRREGGGNAVLVLAPDGRVLNEIEEERARPRAPAWGPGGESLVWATDRGGTPNLHGVRMGSSGGPVGPVLQITALPTAGSFPAVDEQGRWIYLSVLGADGWELGRIPYRPEEWFEPLSPLGEYGGAAHSPPKSARALDVVVPDVPDSRRYRALPSLVPRYWLPVRTAGERVLGRTVLPVAWGAQSSGADLLERHRWSLRVAAPVRDPGRRVEWGGAYVWAGLGNPVLTVEAGQGWEARPAVLGGGADGAPADTLFPIRRERFAGGAVEFRRPRFRSVAALSLGGRILSIERILLDEGGTESESYGFVRPSGELAEARASATVSSVRGHAWSISTESGVAAALSVRQRWELALPDTLRGVGGADGGFREGVLTVRAFGNLEGPGFARHVVALRATGGIARGPGAGADHFEVGGDLRQFPVRGHPADALRGERAWSVSAEWRFPLGVLDAGPGAWPIYLDRLAGGVFFDTGGAGASGPSHGRAGATTIASAGVELALTHTLFWEELRRVALGVAFPVVSDRTPSVHARFGWSF